MKILRILVVLAVAAAMTLVASSAAAQGWDGAFPGVQYHSDTRPGPVEVRAVEVDLCATGVNLRATGSAESPQTTSSFGSSVGAQVAVNGDFYDGNFTPIGFAMGNGEHWASEGQDWGFIAAGQHDVQIASPLDDVPAPQDWMTDAVGGNIMVLTDGAVTQDSGSFCTNRHPRTAAGLSADGTKLYLAVADGRTSASIGMTCAELGQFMAELGAQNALNLDGGGSTTMWRSDAGVVNVPSDGSERTVSNHFAVYADGDSPAMSCPEFDVDVETNFLGIDVVNTDGDGDEYPDVFVGDEFQAEILVTNHSVGVLRDVWIGYWFEHPHIEAVDYTIYSDHPHYDQESWEVNDSNEAPENPDGDQMGQSDYLNLYAFSPGETKRIVVDLEATGYSIGQADHPDVRAFMRHIQLAYGYADDYFDEPELNRVGELLRDFSELDVLARDHWHFAGPQEDHFEGWRKCGGEAEGLAVDTGAEQLVVSGDDVCVRAPDWTGIDADDYDELVVVFGDEQVPGDFDVGWGGDGAGYVAYDIDAQPGDAVVLEVGTVDSWSGTIDSLTLQSDTAADAAVDAIFVQSSNDETTSTSLMDYVDGVRPEATDSGEGDNGDDGENGDNGDNGDDGDDGENGDNGDNGDDGADAGVPSDDAGTGGDADPGQDDDGTTTTSSGCNTTAGGSSPPSALLLVAGLLAVARLRV